ncbi:hypothetical protein [Shouchella clausii]|uniref:hypothetical protein n=1 Tax=Shouchella clausii TaxID=79880 RepID=UPI0031CC7BFF
MHKLIDKFEEHQEVRIHRIDIDHILTYISEETGINKQDLRVGKRVSISNTQTEIIILNRYKNIRVIYDEKNCKLIEYEGDRQEFCVNENPNLCSVRPLSLFSSFKHAY